MKNPNTDVDAAIDSIAQAVAKLIGATSAELPSKRAETLYVYWAGAAGLATIAKDAGRYISKIGTSNNARIEDRLAELGRDGYCAYAKRDAAVSEREAGFDRWMCHTIATSREPRDGSIEVLPRTLKIELPTMMTRRGFDQALHRALRPWALENIKSSCCRWTAYGIGEVRWSRAQELYALDPRRDGDRLLGLVEAILAGHRERRLGSA